MANSDKNIVITPNIGSTTSDPKIVFSGAGATSGPQNITLSIYPTNSGTLSFDGSAGQLFNITNSLSGTIFSVNDVSGIPSIEVLDTGLVKVAEYSGNVLLGTSTDNGTNKLQVAGNISSSGTITATTFSGSLTGNASTATTLATARNIGGVSFNGSANIDLPGVNLAGTQNTSGSAATLTTGRTISLTGDVTYTSGAFNGSANVTSAATLASVGTAGTYTKVTTDAKGRVTSGTTLADTDIPNLNASKITAGTINAARLPSYVDDVIEATNLAAFPATGETGKIYVALDTNKTYRWSGSAYIFITSGAVDSVAGKTGVVTLVKADVGLGSVDNTADSTKNVATAVNISNTGTVTLASATESNSIYATAPSYTADQPTKLLNFDWYSNVFSLGNIRSGSTGSNGFGVYYTASGGSRTELARFLTSGNFGIGTTAPLAKLDVAGQGMFQGSTLPAYRGVNIGAVNINNNTVDGTVDFTQGLVFTDNSNNTGAWAHAGIVSTGSANFNGTLVFGTDGNGTNTNAITERMRIDSSGNVGIGTSSPTDKLSVSGNIDIGVTNKLYNGASQDSAGIAFPSGTTRIDGLSGITFHSSATNVGSQAERMRITSAGNVGIGTSSPAYKLDVSLAAGANLARFVGPEYSQTVFVGGTQGCYIQNWNSVSVLGTDSASPLAFSTNSTERMRIDASGNVGIGLSPTAKLHVAGTIQSSSGSTTAQMFADGGAAYFASVGAFPSIFLTNGAERMRIDASGNVSIGTTVTSSAFCVARGAGVAGAISLRGGNVAEASEFWVAQGSGGTEAYLYNRANGPMIFGTNNAERARIHASGGVSIGNTVDTGAASLNVTGNVVFQDRVYTKMTAPTAKNASATLTGAEIMQGYLQVTGVTTTTFTMPTGTALQAAMPASVAALNNISFDFTIIGAGAASASLAANTGITTIGSLFISTSNAVTFRIRKTATNTFVVYRT